MSDLERVTAPEYTEGVADHTLAELRARRAECQELENAMSYVRRLVHGRMDIVAAEGARRRDGAPTDALSEIIEHLPSVLADRHPHRGQPRPPLDLAPTSSLADELLARVDAEFPPGGVGGLVDLRDEELTSLADRLREEEQRLSRDRRRLHEIIDVIQGEIIRRYETGEASVESLLS